jgi:hypothetical protein
MSDLRSRTIRLAYVNPTVRPYLLGIVADRVAMEFDTQDALDAYLDDHPKADKSKHNVKSESGGEGARKEHTHAPGSSLKSKLKEHVQQVLFDDVGEAWTESKEAYEDIVKAVGAKKRSSKRQGILADFKSANEATKTFFSNRGYRRNKMRALGRSIKDGAKALGNRILHAAKAEVKEAWTGVKALGQVITPGSPALDKGQKKALYGLGAYVAGAALAAAGGGVAMAGVAISKSFSLHVGIKAISHLADSFFVHYEWGVEGTHIVHGVTNALSHVASEKDDEASAALMEAMVLAVSKVLEEGMSDEDVEAMLSGKDDEDYDDVSDIPALDKLKTKADEEGTKGTKTKSDKEASLRGQVIRLAHSRPDLRPHLLAALVD